MSTGWLLGGLACLIYAGAVGYFGGVKKAPGLLKMVKMKINKKMSDDAAAKICLWAAIVVGIFGIVCFIIGAN
ncbi:MAG: hypothetical protein JXQ23_07490 [Clostridia bacterium]|nr:hypothetical protein [Clostridia bacterium]